LPVPADRAFDVTLVIRRGIDIDFNETKAGVFPMGGDPVGFYQYSGCEYCSDMTVLLESGTGEIWIILTSLVG